MKIETLGLLFLIALSMPLQRAGAQEDGIASTAPPVAVRTVRAERVPSYTVSDSHTGRVEATRTIDMAFEQSGTLQFVMAEEGQRVAEGETLAQLETRALKAELLSQLSSREGYSASLELSRDSLNRLSELDSRGFAADQALVNARSEVVRASAALDEVNAGILSLEIAIAKSDLKAPFSGIVGRRLFDDGATVGAGETVLTLFDDSSTVVRVGLPPSLVGSLSADEGYTVVDGDSSREVRFVGVRPDLETSTRTVEARFAFEEDPASIPFAYGQLVTLRMTRSVAEPGYWLPLSALSEGERGLWSVLVVEDAASSAGEASDARQVRRHHAEVLHADGERVYVRADLPRSVEVVSTGGHRVVSGQRVQIASIAR